MKRPRLALDRWSVVFLVMSLIFTAVQVAVFVASSKLLPPQVPLLYSLPWGDGQLVPPTWLWLLPGTSITVTILNLSLSRILRREVLTRILLSSAFLISFLALISFLKIVLLEIP